MAISLSLNTTPTTSVGCVEGTVFYIPDKYTTDDELKKAIAEIPKPDLSGFIEVKINMVLTYTKQ